MTARQYSHGQAIELAKHYTEESVKFVGRYLDAERRLDALFDEYAAKPQFANEPRKVAKKGAKADPRFADCIDDLAVYRAGAQMASGVALALYEYAKHV